MCALFFNPCDTTLNLNSSGADGKAVEFVLEIFVQNLVFFLMGNGCLIIL